MRIALTRRVEWEFLANLRKKLRGYPKHLGLVKGGLLGPEGLVSYKPEVF
jgi:hypothetical protein